MKRFKILCFLLFIFIFAGIIQILIVDFAGGYKLSSDVLEYAISKDMKYTSHVAMNITIKDKANLKNNEINTQTQDSIILIPERATIVVPHKECDHENSFMDIFMLINSLALITINIILITYFVKIIWVFTRKDFFDKRITRWLSIVGISFISFSILVSTWHLMKMYYINQMVELSQYNINYGSVFDFDNLTTGLIVLVVNEILKSAIGIKQEQDLTI